jgi:hypothetical protein
MKLLALLLTCGLSAQTLEAPKTLYAHVDFVGVAAGKASDYHKALKDSVLPKLRERLESGDEYAFLNYARMFPHGSGQASEEIRILLSRRMKGAAANVTSGTGMPTGLFHTVQGELWRTRHAVNLEGFLQSAVVRAVFLRPRDGKTNNDTIELYRSANATREDAAFDGLLLLERIFPGGSGSSGEYTMVVLWGYSNIDEIDAVYDRPGQPAERALDLERLQQVRDVVRTELWQRRPEFIIPR